MIIISHRGNLEGPSESENSLKAIDDALCLGFDIEIDVWYKSEKLFLGHDKPQHLIDLKYLEERKDNLWIHCKDLESLFFFSRKDVQLEYFWHQTDKYTLTRNNFIWTYPNEMITTKSVAVLPSSVEEVLMHNPYGICTDHPFDVRKVLSKMQQGTNV